MHLISIKHQQGFTPTPTLKKSNNNLPPKHNESRCGGFTLIELLVVIAIIGILASVVLASLNTARTKGQIASIKSNLKNIIPQAELAYDVPGNYSTVCTDTKVAGMLTAITNAGGTAACYSYNNTTTDINTRWGVSAKFNSDNTQNFSVDSTGVVTWDTADLTSSDLPGGNTKSWADANTACANVGGRLPSIEELKALSLSYSSTTPPSFFASYNYWSSTTSLSNSGNAYDVVMSSGNVYGDAKSTNVKARCVH